MSFSLTYAQLRSDLEKALKDAARHKSSRQYVQDYFSRKDDNLDILARELFERSYRPSPSIYFAVKGNREVFAARFRDRIVHHLYFNYTHDLFERIFINDSYSCIKGRGTQYGIDRMNRMVMRESHGCTRKCYVLALDIKGYFMHIDRQLLCDTVETSLDGMKNHKVNVNRAEKWDDVLDFGFLNWLTELFTLQDPLKDAIMKGSGEMLGKIPHRKRLKYSPEGSGIGIGNLTAQLFSNIFLNRLDQFIKRTLKVRCYGRYVDDLRLISTSRTFLLQCRERIDEFLKGMKLELQHNKTRVYDAYKGFPFLGVYILPFRNYISNTTLKKVVTGMNALKRDYEQGRITLSELLSSAASYQGFASHCRTFNIMRKYNPLFAERPALAALKGL